MSAIIRKLNIFNQIKQILIQEYKLLITLLVAALAFVWHISNLYNL